MHRPLIPLVAAVVLILVTGAVYFTVKGSMTSEIQSDLQARVLRARHQFDESLREQGFNLMAQATNFSTWDDVAKTFGHDPDKDLDGMRRQGYIAAFAFAAKLKEQNGRDPETVEILDKSGTVVSRNDDAYFNHAGEHLESTVPTSKLSIDGALKGDITFDVWNFEGKMVYAAVAPVKDGQNGIVGAVVIAFDLSKQQAEADSKLLDASVAYFLDKKVQSGYFLDEGREDPDRASRLGDYLFNGSDRVAEHTLAGDQDGGPFRTDLDGNDYIGSATRLPGLSKNAGAVLLVNVNAALASANRAGLAAVLIGLLGLVVMILVEVLTARRFLVAIDEIERGLEEIITGNTEYMFRAVSPDLEGTANALNVMLARLIPGRPEGGEDEEGMSRLAQVAVDDADQASMSQAQGGPAANDPEMVRLAHEPEQDYFRRLFGEYTEAKKAKGEDVSGQTFDSFVAKLRLSEGNLKKKYNCRTVRFRVLARDGQVTLKPVPIY